MPKLVQSWNEWDPLKRVIVGRPEGTNVPAPEPAWTYDLPEGGFPLGSWGPFPQEMVDAANEQMDYFVSVLEDHDVIVDRIDIQPFMLNRPQVSVLNWSGGQGGNEGGFGVHPNAHGVNNVRDVTMIHGNYIVEATTVRRTRVYERYNLRPLFEHYRKEDPEMVHFAAPMPRLEDDSYVPNFDYKLEHVWSDEEKLERLHRGEFQLTEQEALWDAADAMRFGRDIFHQVSAVSNWSGVDWLKRMFEPLGVRVHPVVFTSPMDPEKPDNFKPWHIDVNLVPLRPGLAMVNPDWSPHTKELYELFEKNDWELVEAARPTHVHRNKVFLTGLYEGKSWISMNTFSIDPETVCVEAHETAYIEQLENLGFNVIPIPYEKVIPFGGALHCTTLDVYREGELEDYFPKQVEGY